MKINFIFQVLSFGMAFIINIYLLKTLNVEDYGMYSLLNTIIMFGAMAFCLNIQEYLNIGLNKYKKYSVSQNTFFNNINTLMILINIVIGISLFLLSSFISLLFNIPEKLIYLTILLIFMNIIFANYLRYDVANSNWISYNIFLFNKNYGWFVAFLLIGIDIVDIFSYMLFITIIFVLVYCLYFKKKYNFKSYFDFDFEVWNEGFIFGMRSLLSTFSFFIIMNSDKIMISIFSGNREVGLYAFAIIPFSIVLQLFQNTILAVVNPKINRLFHKKKKIRFLIYKKLIYFILITFSPIYIIFTLYSDFFILFIAKDEYLEVGSFFAYLSACFILLAISSVLKQEFILKKEFSTLNKISLTSVLINIGFSYLSIKLFGYVGVVYSTLIVYLIINTYLYYRLKREEIE
ncbi:oligosaccharide flippase family protein [Sulfurospirillum sp. UCH001]|uniref:oligosaccharide flippase family protein n=1 Tax=Sulfurospirillum sp. UCH001 TaxID=1581011 RepID=UPI0008346D37|nr:oligosaccharide flippase family protein [Sulfurospirillum sp. UCH001]